MQVGQKAVFGFKIVVFFLCQFLVGYGEIYNAKKIAENLEQNTEIYSVLPSGSMKPTFDEDDLLIVRKTPFKNLKVKDIILYINKELAEVSGCPEAAISHRIIRRSSGGSALILKGDANYSPDDKLVTEDMYVGKVIGIIKKSEVAIDNHP